MASELPAHRVKLISESTDLAKAYLREKQIPQLFEALMTGLMFRQPDDHLDYLIRCLQKIKHRKATHVNKELSIADFNKDGTFKGDLKWDTFVANKEEDKN